MNIIAKIVRRLRPPTEVLDGYENPELVETVFRKTAAYSGGTKLDFAADAVLDFGGGCGIAARQVIGYGRWAVVETAGMATRARELETANLMFFTSISEAVVWLGKVAVMFSDSALPYVQEPEKVLAELCAVGAEAMIWKRTFLAPVRTVERQRSHLADNGPGQIGGIANKLVEYTRTLVAEDAFMAVHRGRGYQLVERRNMDFRFVKS